MKKMTKLFAVLSACVLALCGVSSAAFAADDGVDWNELITYTGAAPVYALGHDLSVYPAGDADLNGEVTIKDASLILTHFTLKLVGLTGQLLNDDQVEVADVDGKTFRIEMPQQDSRLSPFDASYVLTFATLRLAGYTVTMEDVVSGNFERPAK